MARDSWGRSIRAGALVGMFVMLTALLIAVAVDGWSTDTDGPLAEGVLGAIVLGLAVGGTAGAVKHVVGKWLRVDEPPAVSQARRRFVDDPWSKPVEQCEESARAVTRLLGTLPDSAAADWLTQIAETMSAKLTEIHALADAGRAVAPATDKHGVLEAQRHPLHARLECAADEFAAVADQVGKLMVELHAPLDLEHVRSQLHLLTEQLPLLRKLP